MNNKTLYRKVSATIDILCVIGFPLALGILVNYVLGVGVLVFVVIVTLLRRRFLDEKAQGLVLGGIPRSGRKDETAASSRAGDKPIRIMALAVLLATCLVVVRVVVALSVGDSFPWIPVVCLLAIWFGVAMVAVGNRLGRR
jgi:hypothetical protein